MTPFEVFLLADVQQEEGAVDDGGRDRVLLVGSLLPRRRGRQGVRSGGGSDDGSGLAPAAHRGRAVIKVEAVGSVPGVLEKWDD